jgi:hypothetical protein
MLAVLLALVRCTGLQQRAHVLQRGRAGGDEASSQRHMQPTLSLVYTLDPTLPTCLDACGVRASPNSQAGERRALTYFLRSGCFRWVVGDSQGSRRLDCGAARPHQEMPNLEAISLRIVTCNRMGVCPPVDDAAQEETSARIV